MAVPRPDLHSVPARFAQIGFTFFVVIIISSYTAHLVAIVLREGQKNVWFPMASVEEAVKRRATICIHHLVLPVALAKYPKAIFVAVDSSDQIPGMINDQNCTAASEHISKSRIHRCHDTTYNYAIT
jgi:hypothetical protein